MKNFVSVASENGPCQTVLLLPQVGETVVDNYLLSFTVSRHNVFRHDEEPQENHGFLEELEEVPSPDDPQLILY